MTASLIGGFNTGIQRSWTVIDNTTGLPVDFGGDVLDLEGSPLTKDIEIDPISSRGYSKFKTARHGWTGTMTIARNNGAMDNFEAVQELLYHTGFTQKYFTIIEKTYNDDGSIDTFQYSGCELKMTTSGMAKLDSPVEIKLAVRGQSKQPV